MGSLCGPSQQTTTTSSSPPPQVLASYQNLVNQAQNVAATPYQQYSGDIVAPTTTDQNVAMQNMDYLYGMTTPYINQASNYLNQSASPINISNANTSQYVSPYAQAGAANAQAAGNGIAAYGTQAGQNIANYGNNAGNNIANYATGIGAQGPQLQQYNQQNLQQFLNPYTQNVVNTTMANLNQNDAIQQNSLTGQAIQSGNAFGGDRAGVAASELARNQDMANNQTIAGLESAGYTNAQSAFNTNNQQALAGQQTALQGVTAGANLGLGAQQAGAQLGVNAQQAGAQLGLSGAQLGTGATQNAQQLALSQQQAQNSNAANAGVQTAALGNQALNNQLTAANAQLQSGTLQQQQNQNQISAAYQQFLQQQAYPFQTTNWLGNTVLGVGSASGGTGTTVAPGPSVLGQVAGLGAAGLGAYMASDERVKENVEQVGKSFDGQPIYRFNYKGSPTTQMGLMAQQVEHSHPGAVAEHNGLKYVNYHEATEDAADRGHFAGGGQVGNGGIPGLSANAPGMFQPIDFSSHGVSGYVPDAGQMKMGSGPPKPPSAPSTAALPAGLNSGTATAIGKGISGLNQSNPLAYGASVPGADGPTSVGGAPLNYSGDLGAIYADGGFVGGLGDLRGFATDGAVTADDGDVINPGDPIRLDPAAMDRWRQSADFAADHKDAPDPVPGLAQAPPPSNLPPEISSGVSGARPPPAIASAPMAYAAPPSAGVSAAPSPAPNPNGQALLDQAMAANAPAPAEKPSPWLALMHAGLAMAASRSPQILGAVGEGGLAGLSAYEKAQQEYNKLDEHPVIDHSGPTTRIYYPSTKQWIDTGIPTMTAGQKQEHEDAKAQRDLTNASADLIKGADGKMIPNPAKIEYQKQLKDLTEDKIKPGIIDYKDDGTPIQGFIDSTNKKYYLPGGKEYTPRSPDPSSASAAESPTIEKVQKDGTVNVNKAQASAPYNYAKNSPVVEKGYDVPPPAPVAGKSQQTIEAEAEYYLQTGKFLTPANRSSTVNAIQQQNYRTAVQNYANTLAASRGMSPTEVAEGWRTAPAMTKFILGPDGRSTVALGTAERHLDTLKEYIKAYNGNDQPTLRRLGAIVDKQFGRTGATTIDAMSSVVGPEIVKALGVAGAGTESERSNFEHMFQQGTSQAMAAIDGINKLLGGQLEGKERQAKEVGVSQDKFKRLIGDDEYNKIKGVGKTAAVAAPPSSLPTATGPDGRKLVLRNGKWEPLQ